MNNFKKTAPFSFKKRLQSFGFAINGIIKVIQNEHNARIHVLALILVVSSGLFLDIDSMEWIAISIVAGMVILTELLNTAIERLADFVEPKWNDKIGLIKDYCAGAVLISAVVAAIVGGIIFIPKLMMITE